MRCDPAAAERGSTLPFVLVCWTVAALGSVVLVVVAIQKASPRVEGKIDQAMPSRRGGWSRPLATVKTPILVLNTM